MRIVIEHSLGVWWWWVERIDSGRVLASGTSPDYHQACEQARIAWEQHSEGER